MRTRALRLAFLALSGLLAIACSRPIEAELLELRAASPERIQPGHRLTLRGTGFPAGREARVTLAGAMHRPGHAPRAIDAALEGEAISSELVEVPMSAATIRRLGGRGTFRGAIRVAFGAGALDGGTVVGTLDRAVLDLVPGGALDAPDPSIAARLGLELATREDHEPGLVVAAVVPGGRADRAGLAEGDRILSADDLTLLAKSELLPIPGAPSMALRVFREGEPVPFTTRISLDGWTERIPRGSILAVQLAALIALAALLLLGPGATWIDRLAPGSRRVPWGLVGLSAALALALRAGLSAMPSLGLDAALLAIVAGRGAALVLGASGELGRVAALVRALGGALAIAVALGVATLAIGTTDPAAVEAAQGAWPSDWLALRSPSGPLAALLVLLAAAAGPVSSGERDLRRRLDDLFLAALAACATIALAGGAAAHDAIADVRPGLGWIGSAAFVAMAALVTVVLSRVRDRGAAAKTALLFAATLATASAAIVVALGWIELEAPREIERAIAEILVAVAVVVVVRLATTRPPEPARPHHALL